MRSRQDGQATVELVAVLPCIVAVLAAVWQVVLAADAASSVATAARAAARAAAVGGDPAAAARRHLPPRLERGLRVNRGADGAVGVSVRVPTVLGALHLGRAHSTARFQPQGSP
jgi:TadE-like protein